MAKKRLTAEDKRILIHQNKMLIRNWLKYNLPKIIGMDISTRSSGLYFLEQEECFLIQPEYDDIRKRINNTKEILAELLETKLPNIAFIEDYSLSLHSSSVVQLAECGGVIRDLLYDFDIPLFAVAPQTLKKFVLGQGKGSKAKGKQAKSLMLLEVFDRWNVKFDNDDECDAFCLAKFGESLFAYVQKKELRKWEQNMFDNFLAMRGDVF